MAARREPRLDTAAAAGHAGHGGGTGGTMGWIALGVLAFAGGVLLLRAGMPGRRAHAAIVRNALLGEVHVFAFLLLVVFGFALAIKGLFGLAA